MAKIILCNICNVFYVLKCLSFSFLILFHEACECSHLGNNCDPHTGRCICPPNTTGNRCEKCVPNHWGHDIISGCKVSVPFLPFSTVLTLGSYTK